MIKASMTSARLACSLDASYLIWLCKSRLENYCTIIVFFMNGCLALLFVLLSHVLEAAYAPLWWCWISFDKQLWLHWLSYSMAALHSTEKVAKYCDPTIVVCYPLILSGIENTSPCFMVCHQKYQRKHLFRCFPFHSISTICLESVLL